MRSARCPTGWLSSRSSWPRPLVASPSRARRSVRCATCAGATRRPVNPRAYHCPMGHGRWAFALTLAGFAWGVALVAGAFVVPVYSGLSVSAGSSGEQVTHSYSSTLVEENGFGVLIPVAIPLVLAALVWFALHRRCARGSRWGGPIAWSLVAVLGLLGVVA